MLIVSAARRSITWLVRDGDGYIEARASRVLGAVSESLSGLIDWPLT